MLTRLINAEYPASSFIPTLDDEFVSDDLHPVLYEISALRRQRLQDEI